MKEFTHEDYLRSLKEWMKCADDFVDAVKKGYSKCNEESALYDDYESEDKMVSHPSHYQSKNGIEVIDVIEAFTDDLEGIEAVCAGNAIKYLCRWSKKNGVQDLEKSIWYIQKLINVLKSKNKE